MNTEVKLIKVMNDFLNISTCSLETKRDDVESWDSLAHVMLLSEIESSFEVSIPIENFAAVASVRDIYNLIAKHE